MKKEVLKYPHQTLRKKAQPVTKISKEVLELVDDLIETVMVEDGVGLASNQLGSALRIFVLNTTNEEESKPQVFINPEIIDEIGEINEEEGCLSFPDLYINIKRADVVRLQATNIYGESLVYEAKGLLARAIQHEIDHLNGVLLIDHCGDTDSEKVRIYLEQLKTKE